jgi:hypothetical protein
VTERRPWHPRQGRGRGRGIADGVAVLALAGVSLVGCADDAADRSFAPIGGVTAGPGGTPTLPTVEPAAPPTVPAAPTLTTAELFQPRGAPSRIYFEVGGALWSRSPGGAPAEFFQPEAGTRIVGTAPSPSGDRVGVLLGREAEGAPTTDLLVLDGAGQELQRIEDLGRIVGPEGGAPAAVVVDWSPQGDQLLAAFASGELARFDASGSGTPGVVAATPVGTPVAARWSPSGAVIAVLAEDESDGRALSLIPIDQATPQAAVALGENRSPSAIAWSPNGKALLVVERGVGGSPTTSGDLWEIGLEAGKRRLIASAGVAAPIAAVDLVEPSPDGQTVAFTVVVPEGERTRFHSLRIEELRSGRALEVPVPEGEAVADLWWTGDGLVFRSVPGASAASGDEGGAFGLYLATGEGEPERIFAFEGAEGGSPEAGTPSPPAASPVAAD